MQNLSKRILSGSEKGLIIDKDTLYMDSIGRALGLVTKYREYLKPFYYDHTKLQLISVLVSNPDDYYVDLLFTDEGAVFISVEELDALETYDRTDPDLLTDMGFNISSFKAHNVKWFVLKEEANKNSYEVFKEKEIVLPELDIDNILSIIKANNISIIIAPTAEIVSRLATELKDITIVYPTYGTNMKEAVEGAFFFKYHYTLDKYEVENQLEILNYNPLGRFVSSAIAMG